MNYLNKNNIKKKYISLNPWVFSITSAVLIYAILFFLFTSAKIKKVNITEHKPQIIMLPLNNKNPNQSQLLYWLKDDNPTLVVEPNSTYGYSSILRPDFKFSNLDASIDIESVFIPHYFFSIPFDIYPIEVKRLSLAYLFSRLSLLNYPIVPPIPFHTIAPLNISYPYVKEYYSGIQIPIMFNNLETLQQLINKDNPQKPTILSIEVSSNPIYFPLITIISSSGSYELDKKALDNLTTARFNELKKFQGRQMKLYIEWQ